MEAFLLILALAFAAYLNIKFGDSTSTESEEPRPGSCYCGHPACTGPISPYHRDTFEDD